MDSDELKSVILKGKSKGIQYMITHHELIQSLINEGETANAIYDALCTTDSPPPISKSQFYRHLKKHKQPNSSEISNTSLDLPAKLNIVKTQSNHAVLSTLKTEVTSIHDSAFDADKLI